ncbi:HU family DNA-binding protein [Ruminobacter sp.]|uniref:HU family DNA-binding protein n=1 Tax=Ruminobacter sp. TaxID=2774296 RepID=UPI00386408F2
MNKQELIEAIAEKSHTSRSDSKKMLDAFLETVTETLAHGDSVQLIGFGTFKSTERNARSGRNPRTGETVTIPAKRVPAFTAGNALKEAVQRGK